MTFRIALLSTAAILSPAPLWAQAQEEAPPAAPASAQAGDIPLTADDPMLDEFAEEETIVVTGARPRGSVVGDIPPEDVLDPRDIRATGATSISELLDAVAAQTGSARGRSGGRPILLLNGLRISGFRELRDLPPEAIERMEIFPEEVALKYGYSADQRVVNIVLRPRFNSTSVEVRARAATEGGYVAGQAEATRLTIRDGQRTSLNLRVDGNSSLTESERDIALQPVASVPDPIDPRGSRTLLGQARSARVTGTLNRTILGDVGATVSGEVGLSTGRSRFGVATGTLTDEGETILRAIDDPLVRNTISDTAALGLALNTQKGSWRLSSIANADLSRNVSRSDCGLDLSGAQARLDAGDPTFDPFGDIGPLDRLGGNRSRSNRRTFTLDGTASGPLFELPAGDANATFKLGAGRTDLDSRATRADVVTETDLGRTSGEASVNLDLPILARDSKLGRLTANANAGVTQLSDFGTLTSLGGGLNWSSSTRLRFIASVTREQGPPSLKQLGDPLLETPGVRFFDATRGETVDVLALTGGNPALDADTRRVMKLGANWQPIEDFDLRLRADYVRSTIDNPQSSFPAASEALEAAFPDRFERGADGRLLRVDLRPVNFDRARRDTLRWGFDFTKPLASKPPSAETIAALRARRAASRPARQAPAAGEATPPAAGEAPAAPEQRVGGGGRRGGGGGGGRFGGGRQGGRLTLSMTHTVNFVDRVTIADGIDDLDYLGGEAAGQAGGRSRHEVELEAGYFNNAFGARLSGDWRSGTRVDSSRDGGDLNFLPYAKVDLRLFANLGQRLDLVAKNPWLRGTSVQFRIDNIFNARPKVRDSSGATPFSYQPGLLEPIGRTVGITFRKLFIPIRFGRGGGGRGGGRRGS